MARRPRLSIAFWLVLLTLCGVMDTFVTPYWMNHHHGFLRALGFMIGGFTALPAVMLVVRIYQYITLKMFVRSINP